MEYPYLSQERRKPDYQYAERLKTILYKGDVVRDTPQGIGAATCFGTLSPMIFELENGVPFITERSVLAFWKKAVGELIAFINGARTIEQIESYGSDFWNDYKGKGTDLGLEPNDMGPGSYGPAFHDFEVPEGGTLNQFAEIIDQIKKYPKVRTHLITPWKPYYTGRGERRKVIVAPCHGWLHFRVINGRLHMRMDQRSADMPIGVPSNMIMYSTLLLMMSQVTGYPPGTYVHSFADAHIYEDQVDAVRKLLTREPFPFPVLRLNPKVKNLFDFRVEDFTLEEYESHKGLKIAYRP
jgi:thymidylate synthase